MNKLSMAMVKYRIAKLATLALCAVLFVCANTTSCTMVYQPESPAGLDRFSKTK